MRSTTDAPVTVRRLSPPADHRAELAVDVRAGMEESPRRIPSKYFYDARGSWLFEEITRLPEYYLTPIETEILTERASRILAVTNPDELIELGSGASEKTRLLLDAMLEFSDGRRYVPIDISQAAVETAVKQLCEDYLTLAIDGLVGDYDDDLVHVPRRGSRLVTFLGSTIGNLRSPERVTFFRRVAEMLESGDHFLLGVDLVKDIPTMVAAYDDSAGITADFTQNVLTVINRELDADFDVESFAHRPVWNPDDSCMEAWLEATEDAHVTIGDLGIEIDIRAGERIHTEVSCKFTPEALEAELAEAGLTVIDWNTDSRGWYALPLIAPSPNPGFWRV